MFKTMKDMNLHGKRVLLRADYNVPLKKDGTIADDYRIKASLPTVQYLLSQGAHLIICSHLGRPKSKRDSEFSLKPVAKRLHELTKVPVHFADDCIGPVATSAVKDLPQGEILLLENLRFHPEEEANDKLFAEGLATLADVFVQDGFGVVHRAHASTEGVTHFLPSVGGLLLEKEFVTLTNVISHPKHPLMAIIGGAKISDKIEILRRFIDIADFVVVGGAMANTFLLAEGIETGKSLAEHKDVPLAKEIMERAKAKAKTRPFVFYLPQDGVVATSIDSQAKTRIVDWHTQVVADIEHYPHQPPHEASRVKANEMILDIGPFSGAFIAGALQNIETVIWNGTMGVTEVDARSGLGPVGPFAHGTELVVEALLGQYGHKPFTVVGGGDTVSYVEEHNLVDAFGHVSTGGGASLELMSGKKLPGIEALQKIKTTGHTAHDAKAATKVIQSDRKA